MPQQPSQARSLHHAVNCLNVRFRKTNPSDALNNYITQITEIENISMKHISDYVILVSSMLLIFRVSKREIQRFVKDFVQIYQGLINNINISIYHKIIPIDIDKKMEKLQKYIKEFKY